MQIIFKNDRLKKVLIFLARIGLGILVIFFLSLAFLYLVEYFSSFFALEQLDSGHREQKVNIIKFIIDYLREYIVGGLFFLTCTLFVWREIRIFFHIKNVWITRIITIGSIVGYTTFCGLKIFDSSNNYINTGLLTNIRIIQSCIKMGGEAYYNEYDQFQDTKSERILRERMESKKEQELDIYLKRDPRVCQGLAVISNPSHTIACKCSKGYYYGSVEEGCIANSEEAVYIAKKNNIYGEANMYLFKGNFSNEESVKNIKTQIRKDPNILLVSGEE